MDASAADQPDFLARLREQHAHLEQQLGQLQSKPYLSDDEQFEETRLKKLKLHVKDRLAGISMNGAGHAA